MHRSYIAMVHNPKRIVQVVAAAWLICSMPARADNCAGGTDDTGNDCNGRETTYNVTKAGSSIPYLKGAARMAQQKVIQAKQRQRAANDEVTATEAQFKVAIKALSDAERAGLRKVKIVRP